MNTPIPYRLYYSAAETAQLCGCSRESIYELIRVGEREEPPPGAILPDQVRRLNTKICVSRSWLYPNEANVVAFPQPQPISDADIQRIAEAVAERLASGLMRRSA